MIAYETYPAVFRVRAYLFGRQIWQTTKYSMGDALRVKRENEKNGVTITIDKIERIKSIST